LFKFDFLNARAIVIRDDAERAKEMHDILQAATGAEPSQTTVLRHDGGPAWLRAMSWVRRGVDGPVAYWRRLHRMPVVCLACEANCDAPWVVISEKLPLDLKKTKDAAEDRDSRIIGVRAVALAIFLFVLAVQVPLAMFVWSYVH
jgi:hypothetical protein